MLQKGKPSEVKWIRERWIRLGRGFEVLFSIGDDDNGFVLIELRLWRFSVSWYLGPLAAKGYAERNGKRYILYSKVMRDWN